MQKFIILVFSLFFLISLSLSRHSYKRLKTHVPNGEKLNDHWGYPSHSSPYGPSDEYNLIRYSHDNNGQVEVTSENINDRYLPEPGDGNPDESCELVFPIENNLCRSIKTCGDCALNPYCGIDLFFKLSMVPLL